MKSIFNYFGIFLLVVSLVSCKATIDTVTDYNDKINFKTYKTFNFTQEHWSYLSELDQDRILKAIETELNSKGLTKSYNPDMYITIITGKEDQTKVQNNISYRYGYWDTYPINDIQVIKTTEGSLAIHMIDSKTQKLIWEGKGIGIIEKKYTKEEKEDKIRDFVKAIISKFPPNVHK
jgi:hypothetical protein